MKRLSVALPVMRVDFLVDVVQRARLLPLDTLVLDGVGRGVCGSDELAQDLRLSVRLIDHCLVRLIEEDLLYFDSQTGRLGLTERAQAIWHRQELDQLAFRGEPIVARFSAMQDLVWGGVVPYGPGSPLLRFGSPSGSILLGRGDVPESVLDLSPIKIAALFNAQPWLTRRRGERLVALEGRLGEIRSVGHLLLEFTPYRQHGKVELWPTNDPATNGGPAALLALLARVRRWLQENRGSWEAQYPDQGVAEADSPAFRLFVPFTTFPPLAQWEAMRSRPQEDLETDSHIAQVRAACERFRDDAVPLCVVRDAEHVELCQSLLGAATQSCVIHSAFWSEAGIAQYADQIRAALRRGVRVFLLRGLGVEEDPTERFEILEKLLAEARDVEGELHVSLAPHHSHAKFVVADARAALVSSFNFLQATRDNRQLNLGVYAGTCSDPEHGIGRAVLRNWTSNATGGGVLDGLEQQLGRDELLAGPGAVRPAYGPASDPLSQFLDWHGQLREPVCAWETLTSEAHRDALLVALHTAQKSVTITSGDMSASAVDLVLVSYLRAALARGVRVRLLWGCQARETAEQVRVIEQAKQLHESLGGVGAFVINLEPKLVHCKLLVVDDWVSVVTSYNFLSYRGLRSGAHEFGVKVYSHPLALKLSAIVDSFFA